MLTRADRFTNFVNFSFTDRNVQDGIFFRDMSSHNPSFYCLRHELAPSGATLMSAFQFREVLISLLKMQNNSHRRWLKSDETLKDFCHNNGLQNRTNKRLKFIILKGGWVISVCQQSMNSSPLVGCIHLLRFTNSWQGHRNSVWRQLLRAHNSPSMRDRPPQRGLRPLLFRNSVRVL